MRGELECQNCGDTMNDGDYKAFLVLGVQVGSQEAVPQYYVLVCMVCANFCRGFCGICRTEYNPAYLREMDVILAEDTFGGSEGQWLVALVCGNCDRRY